MWPQPPAIGTEVICAFTARHNVGYLLGSAIGIDRNHMMGGKASAQTMHSKTVFYQFRKKILMIRMIQTQNLQILLQAKI